MDTSQQFSLPIIESQSNLAIDPVCGMTVDPVTAKHTFVHNGKTYYFCCRSCLDKFSKDPAAYLDKANRLSQAGTQPHGHDIQNQHSAGIYTCPMHPEIRQRGFGSSAP